MLRKYARSAAVVASAALVLGAFVAGPADAKKRKKKKPPVVAGCAAPTFVEPKSPSGSRTEAPKAEVLKVTDAATEETPIVVELTHGAALWDTANQQPIQEDTQWVNVQIDPAAASAGLYIRQEWATPSLSDFDLYLWDGPTGEQAALSGASNIAPTTVPFIGETGGMGWESISGFLAADCSAYSIESRAFLTPGEGVTLKIWLGEPAA